MMKRKFIAVILTSLFFNNLVHADTEIAALEKKHKVKIGVFAMRGDKQFAHKEDQRFAYCSTFKWVLCAAVMQKVEAKQASLSQELSYSKSDMLPHSPITSSHLVKDNGRMTVGELCKATIQVSDNAAANILSPLVGNLEGLDKFVREFGDTVMRYDRPEPDLNTNIGGDPRDTTSAKAMSNLMKNTLFGTKLSQGSRDQLMEWLKGTSTGEERIKAGVPKEWVVAHKTGTCSNGGANDIAVIFPSAGGEPIYLSIFTTASSPKGKASEKAIAETAKYVVKHLVGK